MRRKREQYNGMAKEMVQIACNNIRVHQDNTLEKETVKKRCNNLVLRREYD